MKNDMFDTLVDAIVDEMYGAYGLTSDKKDIEQSLKIDLDLNGNRNMSNQEIEDFICDVLDNPESELSLLYPNTYAKLQECF